MRTTGFLNSNRGPARAAAWIGVALVALLAGAAVQAQSFDSGSTGSDGALELTTPGTIVFDPRSFNPPLDPDGDNVYHFTSIRIGPGVTVRLSSRYLNGPVWWLASSPVRIEGVIDLNGQNGQDHSTILNNGSRYSAEAGAGGFGGGLAGTNGALGRMAAQPGLGPGGGRPTGGPGGGGGHDGRGGRFQEEGGPGYGNSYLVPLLGGSGGAGGQGGQQSHEAHGGGGGAGGGAVLIASSASIDVAGTIQANGGQGANGSGIGGGGSGGAIHLLAPTISGGGTLRALGGTGGTNNGLYAGASGRIRLDAFQHLFTGSVSPLPRRASPFEVFLPQNRPSVRVVSVAGVPVPPNPTGSFTVPDVTIGQGSGVPIVIEARNVPVGTAPKLYLLSENGPDQILDAPPLAGTFGQSTATATVTILPGYSRGFVRVTFSPPAP